MKKFKMQKCAKTINNDGKRVMTVTLDLSYTTSRHFWLRLMRIKSPSIEK
jgi:hypothetical protein